MVKAGKAPDLLGIRKAGWNASTLSENMARFPDRPMMRQLARVCHALSQSWYHPHPSSADTRVHTSQYDSQKRADFNYRAEQLDDRATAMYIARPSKFETNERALNVPRLAQPHLISRCEFPVHTALEGKPRWDPATGAGGDPYGVEKAKAKVRCTACELRQLVSHLQAS